MNDFRVCAFTGVGPYKDQHTVLNVLRPWWDFSHISKYALHRQVMRDSTGICWSLLVLLNEWLNYRVFMQCIKIPLDTGWAGSVLEASFWWGCGAVDMTLAGTVKLHDLLPSCLCFNRWQSTELWVICANSALQRFLIKIMLIYLPVVISNFCRTKQFC